MSVGDQVVDETRCAKFGAYPSMGVVRGDMHIFNYHFLYMPFFSSNDLGQTPGRILTHDKSKYADTNDAVFKPVQVRIIKNDI